MSALRGLVPGIHGNGDGYRIDVGPGELDLVEFDERVRSAGSGDDRNAVRQLRAALDLWSEPVLGGVTDELRDAVVPGLVERRLSAQCAWLDAELRLGRHEELLPELRVLAAEHSMDDRFVHRLVLALHRSGRQAEALTAFEDARRVRRDELGLDVTPALWELHRAVLAADPGLDAPAVDRHDPLIRVLGPVEVRGRRAGGPQQRALLGLLAVHAGTVVPSERLVEYLWGDTAPSDARGTVQVYVSRLRKLLRDEPDVAITTTSSGYRLDLPRELVDLHLFRDTAAPGLWRGRPFADVTGGPALERLVAALQAEHRTTSLVPAQLPPDVADFVGRDVERAQLDAVLAERGAVVVLTGSAGVGKTALAVRWSRELADLFPDGALFANLRGYSREEPEPAVGVLGRFLRALGVRADAVPTSVEEASALYRSLLADKRVLVVLDNARDVTAVRSLLPGAPRGLVLVTSRDDLAGLVARDGARRIVVNRFTRDHSVELFRRVLGTAAADTALLEELARRCAHLPLAIRVAAERLTGRPAGELPEDTTLDLLDSDDPDSAVRAVFSWSYRVLEPVPARAFRLLGACPGVDVDILAAAALLGAPIREARRALDALVRAHLVEEHRPGRYQMHDLLRSYAAELAGDADVRGAIDWYCATATKCVDLVDPHRRRLDPPPDRNTERYPVPGTADEALAWLETERANLVAVCRYAAARDLPEGWYLPHTLTRYFLRARHMDDWITTGTAALASAIRLADQVAEAETRTHLASAYANTGRLPDAVVHNQRALELHRSVGSTHGESVALANLGTVHHRMGAFAEAAEHYEAAMRLIATTGDERNESIIVANLAAVQNLVGRHDAALEAGTRAFALAEKSNDDGARTHAARIIGIAHRELGDDAAALQWLETALDAARSGGDESDEGLVLQEMATIHSRRGDHRTAVALLETSVATARRIDDLTMIGIALVDLGEALRAGGDHETARARVEEGLAFARRAGDEHQTSRAERLLASFD
ncbi:AfsR/SARP family transcriptional regulator [Saccharothrix obliqua]|uniref:AfsR/SARP family transcriptional regulator n=1 Tax=Saccharothrix obliqua TaxID=2861747 RepID=UPI001C5E3564|nr:tetratricopeptide repeat protein [Saccharothrix obliqua]MBW4717909.1 tetratricopeptide repeat protein [Saccharothrix obliqua]